MIRGYILATFTILLFGCKKPLPCCQPENFQKVIVNYTAGYTAPQDYVVFSMEISSSGYARLRIDLAFTESGDPDSTKIGYFQGQLPDTSLARLNSYFELFNIDDLESEPIDPHIIIADAPYYNFIIYLQYQRKSVKYRTALQSVLIAVNDYLYFLCRNNTLPRSTTPFVIESD